MPAERPRERIREHAPPVAAAHRRRLRADRARQLADLLRHQILTGGFPGGVLPLEDALGADCGTSRNTVRLALDLLRAERLVERLPGVGTVVVAEKYPHGLDRLTGGREPRTHGRRCPAPPVGCRAAASAPRGGGYRTNTPAWLARSRKYCGATPSTNVTATPIAIADEVSALGTATDGPSVRGSLKNISTITRM